MALPEVTAKLTADVGDFIQEWNKAAAAAAAAAAQIKAAMAAASGNIDTGGISRARAELDQVGESARKAQASLKGFGDGVKQGGKDTDTLGQAAKRAADALGGGSGGGGAGGGLSGSLTKGGGAAQLMAVAVAVLAGLFPAIAAAALAAGAALQGLGVAGAVVVGGWRGIEQAGERLKASMGGLQKQLESVFRSELSGEFQKLGQAISQMDSPLKAIARSVSDVVKAFTGWIRSAAGMSQIENLLGGVDNMMKSLAPGAKALAQAFTAFGEAAAPSLGKIGEAISSVFEGLNKVIQKAKETGMLQKAFEAGAAAISAFGEVLNGIIAVLIEIAGTAGKPAAEAIKSFGKALQDSAPYIATFFQFMAVLMQVLGKVAELIGKLLKATEPLQRVFQAAGMAVSEFIKALDFSKLGEAAKAVGAFAVVLGVSIKKGADTAVEAVKKWWDDTVKDVKKGVDNAIKEVKKFADDPPKEIKKLVDKWTKDVKKWWDDTSKAVKKGTDDAKKEVKKWADDAPKELKKLVDKWGPEVDKWWENTKEAISDGAEKGVEACKDFTNKAWEVLKDAVKNFFQAGMDMGKGIGEGLEQAISNVVGKAKELAQKALDAIKETLGIKSPSVVFRNEVGAMIPEGIAQGIIGNAGKVTDAMNRTGLGAVAAGKGLLGGSAAGGRAGRQAITLQIGSGADSAMGTAIAKLARTGQLKITANAVKR